MQAHLECCPNWSPIPVYCLSRYSLSVGRGLRNALLNYTSYAVGGCRYNAAHDKILAEADCTSQQLTNAPVNTCSKGNDRQLPALVSKILCSGHSARPSYSARLCSFPACFGTGRQSPACKIHVIACRSHLLQVPSLKAVTRESDYAKGWRI